MASGSAKWPAPTRRPSRIMATPSSLKTKAGASGRRASMRDEERPGFAAPPPPGSPPVRARDPGEFADPGPFQAGQVGAAAQGRAEIVGQGADISSRGAVHPEIDERGI